VTVLPFLTPDWPVPAGVRAVSTTRRGGVSPPPYDSLNLAQHVGDDPGNVRANRDALGRALGLPREPTWLRQVHGVSVASAETGQGREADAVIARQAGYVCAVLTADCLPVLFCTDAGDRVAAAHAGWRGLCAGVLERTVSGLGADPAEISAWLGPAIGPDAFEVGDEVRHEFEKLDAGAAAAFRFSRHGHWFADLYLLARQRLESAGVTRIYGGGFCTAGDPGRFFSYRRDGRTGRMASLIWIDPAGGADVGRPIRL